MFCLKHFINPPNKIQNLGQTNYDLLTRVCSMYSYTLFETEFKTYLDGKNCLSTNGMNLI